MESHSIEEKQENVNDITNQNLKALTDKHVLRQQIEETIKLRLVIIDSQELELGKEFEMLATGLKGPSNRVKDSCVYAGCDPEINDIILSELEKGVGKKHFMVQYDKKFKNKFALRDLGEGMGTFIRIDNQLLLKTNNIISFGDSHMIALIESNGSGKITLKFIDGPKAEQKL